MSEAQRTRQIQSSLKKMMNSLKEARTLRAIDRVMEQHPDLRAVRNPIRHAIAKRRREVMHLFEKTRIVAWIWANIYGYGEDHLFPKPLYHPDAAYLAVVQAGVILVLDEQRRRVACFVSEDGSNWKRYRIRRNNPLKNPSIYSCRIKRFPVEPSSSANR